MPVTIPDGKYQCDWLGDTILVVEDGQYFWQRKNTTAPPQQWHLSSNASTTKGWCTHSYTCRFLSITYD